MVHLCVSLDKNREFGSVRITSSTTAALKPASIALGNFDGIHLGHQQVLQPILTNSPHPTVVSFSPHPREFFTGKSLQLLTPIAEKAEQLEKLGIKQLILLPFDDRLSALSPQDFVEKILIGKLQAVKISVGADFRFGSQRQGDARQLKAIASQYGTIVEIVDLKHHDGEEQRISSSLIRQALSEGNILKANQMLGRPYSLSGTVVKGQQLGRKIGFPTANLQVDALKFLPHYGVYAVNTSIDNSIISGVMNLGCRPTVDGQKVAVEIHLFDWKEDIYGRELQVNLKQFIRPEQKFASLDALKAQIAIDCDRVRAIIDR
jgi:riboflavin kinase / FMN adenylyltransferase